MKDPIPERCGFAVTWTVAAIFFAWCGMMTEQHFFFTTAFVFLFVAVLVYLSAIPAYYRNCARAQREADSLSSQQIKEKDHVE